jgi:glyoxylase-like metal-dependent hydrolase (beta-lactamase superfamily II)
LRRYWSSTPELRARSGWDETIRPVEEAGKLRLVDGSLEIAAGVTLRPAGGHTPGHQVVVVEDPEAGKAYLVGDLLHQTLQVEHRDWSPRFDWDAEKARESRELVLGEIEREGARMLSPHFPFPGVGRIEAGKWAPGWGPAKPKEAAVEELAADPIAFWGAWSKAHDADACRVGEDGVKCSCFEGLGSVM